MRPLPSFLTCSATVLVAKALVAAALLLAGSAPLLAATNSLTITEKAGVTTTNYPIQIGRPFVRGEVANFPQAVLNGVSVTTQADVKTRWPDGSVKHAILTFLIPTLAANSTVTVTFRNQATGNNSGYLNADQMLAGGYDFDATMALTNGSTITASARTMLANAAFTYWLQGSVCSSVILADHSVSRAYDIGFDVYKSFRPIFHVTFWPTINKVHVRFIGENANPQAWENVIYSLALTTGHASPASVYSKASFTHYAGSRWTKDYWIGGAPPAIAINHNLAYLASTTLLPNYDMTLTAISESTLASQAALWTGASKDLFDAGNWNTGMQATGGRPDLGPYPSWTVRWLYTGDPRLQTMAFGNADLAAAWTMHMRESNPAKYFDAARNIPAVGKVLSLNARPSITLGDGNQYLNDGAVPEDKFTFAGTWSSGDWSWDAAHQPAPFYPQYLLSGEFWYLEELEFWASASAFKPTATAAWGRGPTGASGGFHDQVRGDGWVLRNRAEAAAAAPDGTPEQAYFASLMDDMIAQWEGVFNITGTPHYNNAVWTFGRNVAAPNLFVDHPRHGLSPLHMAWNSGSTDRAGQTGSDPTKVYTGLAMWEQYIVLAGLGRAKELGFATGPLLRWFAPTLIGQLTTAGFNPYYVGTYTTPVLRLSDHDYFQTWLELQGGWIASWDPKDYIVNGGQVGSETAYTEMAQWAMSYLAGESNGAAAWAQLKSVLSIFATVQGQNPKWATIPRAFAQTSPSAPRDVLIR
jgi:hypothetical protein